MAGKSREPREAAKLPNTSVKAAPKTVVRATTAPDLHPNDDNVIRAAATPDPHPNDKNDTSGPATLTPYERMKKLVAAKDDRTDTVVMNTVEDATRWVQTMMKQQRQRAIERRITETPPSQV
ncbi:hypothetical protein PF003_g29726 [Phytophthora fragariae]|nr:hypothetical protein PF003_g29726 [Phytophthora fragariae]